jgi:hypothetical protein
MHDSGELADSQRAEPTLMTAGCPAVCWLSERARPLVDGHICGVDRAAQRVNGDKLSLTPYPDKVTLSMWRR